MSFSRNKFLPVVLASLTTIGMAQAAELTTSFQGWLGKNQKSEFVDASRWASCYNNGGGECVVVSLTSGTSQCYEQSFDMGVGYELPAPGGWGPFSLSGSKGYSWSSCHERSETTQCQPKPGFKGRAAVLMGERWGTLKATGGKPYRYDHDGTCPQHWSHTARAGFKFLISQCEYSGGTFTKDGYLPEFENLTCDYEKI
ncbi:hypothetical protein FHR47_001810 [Xanthomonas arboricola]|uniref:hypothetical protein n=1 Tax=Xanthomonas cannabis TaxID=1885674 RepID=UPI00161C983E|nr:hypothetical protein [Xanthomonas cannabis]MBB3801562.1 hypothetical protein [Xanthomonas cannabis]